MCLVRPLVWVIFGLLLMLGTACAAQPTLTARSPASSLPTATHLPHRPTPTPSATQHINLVDPQTPLAVAGQAGWEFQRTALADFDGDGAAEQAVLIAQVRLYNNRPLWEDGHVWQVYVEEADGTRTYVYAQFLPFGVLEARLSSTNADEPPQIIVVEQTPHALSVYEIVYQGPQRTQASVLVQRELNNVTCFSGTPNN